VIDHWRRAIRPLLEALEPRVIVEVGMFTGETTAKLLEFASERGAVVHGVDPIETPRFDLEGFRERYGGRFVFHNEPSLEALPKLHDADAVLIDGDHNWYTVYNELTALARVAAEDQRPFPLTLMHDVDWPYGRRDGYYAPDRIPDEYRHPMTTDGLAPFTSELVEGRGVAPGVHKAIDEGTPRNGVRTAVEDFLSDTDTPVTFSDVAGWYGLGILAGAELVERNQALRDQIAVFDSPAWLKEQCQRIEAWRVLAVSRNGDLKREARRKRDPETELASSPALAQGTDRR
jgi:hypothetical protein